MRNLNLEEITDKIRDYSSDIQYSDRNHLEIKITQFFNFLFEQPISKRTLERISEDFNEIKSQIEENNSTINWNKTRTEVKESLITREKQGAFAYFEIKKRFEIEKKYNNHYIELANLWYSPRGVYDQCQEYFNSYFFEPFIELIEWYFRESQIKQERDYFSREEISQLEENFKF